MCGGKENGGRGYLQRREEQVPRGLQPLGRGNGTFRTGGSGAPVATARQRQWWRRRPLWGSDCWRLEGSQGRGESPLTDSTPFSASASGSRRSTPGPGEEDVSHLRHLNLKWPCFTHAHTFQQKLHFNFPKPQARSLMSDGVWAVIFNADNTAWCSLRSSQDSTLEKALPFLLLEMRQQ